MGQIFPAVYLYQHHENECINKPYYNITIFYVWHCIFVDNFFNFEIIIFFLLQEESRESEEQPRILSVSGANSTRTSSILHSRKYNSNKRKACADAKKIPDSFQNDLKNIDTEISSVEIVKDVDPLAETVTYWPCSLCKSTFTKNSSLKMHVCIVHNKMVIEEDVSMLKNQMDDNSNKFECYICKRVYNTKQMLKRHILNVHKVVDPLDSTARTTTVKLEIDLDIEENVLKDF